MLGGIAATPTGMLFICSVSKGLGWDVMGQWGDGGSLCFVGWVRTIQAGYDLNNKRAEETLKTGNAEGKVGT